MQKHFEIVPRQDAWDVRHNEMNIRTCHAKRDAIRVALTLGRMQLRLGDDAEIVLFDQDGAPTARRWLTARSSN